MSGLYIILLGYGGGCLGYGEGIGVYWPSLYSWAPPQKERAGPGPGLRLDCARCMIPTRFLAVLLLEAVTFHWRFLAGCETWRFSINCRTT